MALGDQIKVLKPQTYKIQLHTPKHQKTITLQLTPTQLQTIINKLLKQIRQKYGVKLSYYWALTSGLIIYKVYFSVSVWDHSFYLYIEQVQ